MDHADAAATACTRSNNRALTATILGCMAGLCVVALFVADADPAALAAIVGGMAALIAVLPASKSSACDGCIVSRVFRRKPKAAAVATADAERDNPYAPRA